MGGEVSDRKYLDIPRIQAWGETSLLLNSNLPSWITPEINFLGVCSHLIRRHHLYFWRRVTELHLSPGLGHYLLSGSWIKYSCHTSPAWNKSGSEDLITDAPSLCTNIERQRFHLLTPGLVWSDLEFNYYSRDNGDVRGWCRGRAWPGAVSKYFPSPEYLQA